jgi:hypothetical protein
VAQVAYVTPKTGAWAGACVQGVANLPGSSTQAVNFTIGTFDPNRNDDICVTAQMWLVSQPTVAGGEGMFLTHKYQTSREMGCGDRVHNLAYLPAGTFTHYQTGAKALNVPGRLASIALRVCAYDKKNTSTTLGCSNWNTWWLVGDAVSYAKANTPGALGGQNVHTR